MRYLLGFLCVCALGVVPLVGCGETQPECQSAHDCDDDNECTDDECTVDGECSNTAVADNADCDFNGLPGLCVSGVCEDAMLCEGVECDDDNECTDDVCDPADGMCSNPPVADGTACDFGGLLGRCTSGVCEAAMLAGELFGTWDSVSMEAYGTSTDCPGEIQITDTYLLVCGTNVQTYNADGTFVAIRTTDEFGDPDNWRWEGMWSTEGSTLTWRTTKEGPDGDNLQPLDPPATSTNTWSVSGDTLALWMTGWPTFTWYWEKSTHEDGV